VFSGSGSHLPVRKSSDATTCTVAPDPTSLQWRVLVRHVSYNFESCLPVGEGSGASRVLHLGIMPPYREDFGATTACPTVSCGPRASSIKKILAVLTVRLDTHVPNACTLVSKAADIRAIMGMQDVWTNGYSVRRRDKTEPCRCPCATWQTIRQDIPHAAKDIICYFYPLIISAPTPPVEPWVSM
jgi:hypothetical protein